MSKVEDVVREMVKRSVDGIFYGSPRDIMEDVGTSSGGMYVQLERMGIRQEGKGKSAKWHIPQNIIIKYGS